MEINETNKALYEKAFIGSGDQYDNGVYSWKPSIDEREIEEWCGDEEGHYIPATPLGYRDYILSRAEGLLNILNQPDFVDLTDDRLHHIKREDNVIRQYDRIMTDSGEFVVTGDDEGQFFVIAVSKDNINPDTKTNNMAAFYVEYEK